MKTVLALGFLLSATFGASTTIDLPPWLAYAATLIGGGVGFRLYFLRLEKRLREAAAQTAEAVASKTETDTKRAAADYLTVMEDLGKDMAERLRGERADLIAERQALMDKVTTLEIESARLRADLSRSEQERTRETAAHRERDHVLTMEIQRLHDEVGRLLANRSAERRLDEHES